MASEEEEQGRITWRLGWAGLGLMRKRSRKEELHAALHVERSF